MSIVIVIVILASKRHFFPLVVREEQDSFVLQELDEIFSLLDFEMCLHIQLLNLLIQEVLFG